MKKLVSMLLALAMILAMSTTAFAAENTKLTINDSTDRTYNGYQLLNLTVSLKSACGCEEGATHTDTCYNYAYTVNDKYKDILQNQAGEGNDIIEYLAVLSSDTDNGYGTLREAADAIYRAIKKAEISADKENLTGTSDIDQGYWLFADVTDLKDENKAYSLVIVDTRGQDELTISPKVGLPTVEKKVKDINDSEDNNIDDNEWQDSADHDIGDTVSFQLTATLPSNIDGYESYKIVFHDTLDAGLTLNPDTIKVYMYASVDDAENDTNSTNVTSSFTTINSTPTDGCTFEIGCDDVLGIEGITVTKDTVFVVTYSATLNENAKIGATGNSNKVYLEFSNDPYSDSTGKTEEDKVTVFTYQLTINKVDKNNNPLAGAGFTLYKHNGTEYDKIGEIPAGENTTFEWEGLDDGNYKLVESTVPAGYNKMAPIEFTITAEHDEESTDPQLTELNSTLGTVKTDESSKLTGVIEDNIKNNTGTVLPETGAEGTMMLITGGAMFVIVAAVFMVTRKKMSIYED